MGRTTRSGVCAFLLLAGAVFLGITSFAYGASTRYYVDAGMSVSGDGSNWGAAFKTIGEAVTAAAAGDEIWVAQGSYVLAAPITFKDGLKVYGGFASGATAIGDQNTVLHPAVVSGAALDSTPFVMSGIANGRLDGFTIKDADIDTSGGAVLCTNLDNTNTIANCTIRDNKVGYYASGYLYGSFQYCSGSGGGIYCENASPVIQNCKLTHNRARLSGGGIFIRGGSPQITACTLAENGSCTDTTGYMPMTGTGIGAYDGGGIYVENATVSIFNTLIRDNQCVFRGAGIACFGTSASLTVDQCTIAGNIVGSYGGGIFLQECDATISKSVIAANGGRATSYGGGIRCNGTSPLIYNCLIAGNYCASSQYGVTSRGGAASLAQSTPTLVNCTVVDNEAGYGGAIHCSGSNPRFSACLITRNQNVAGGIYEGDADSDPLMTDCYLDNNGAYRDYYDFDTNQRCNSTTYTLFSNIITPVYGGSPRFTAGLMVPIYDFARPNVIENRWIYQWTLYGDTAYGAGPNYTPGAMAGKLVRILYKTTPTGASMFSRLGYVIDNTTTAVLVTVPNSYNLQSQIICNYQFMDYHLGYGSACIDKAASAGVSTDLEGYVRPIDLPSQGNNGSGTIFDIGAYETQGTEAPDVELTTTTCPIQFGLITAFTSVTETVYVTNAGFSPLTFTGAGIAIGGPAASSYSLFGTVDTSPLAPGESRPITIRFSPTTAYFYGFPEPLKAELVITSNDPDEPTMRYSIEGFGMDTPMDPYLVWVRFGTPGYGSGTMANPFAMMSLALYQVYPGGTIRICAGSSSETCRIAQPVRIESYGGTARVGAN